MWIAKPIEKLSPSELETWTALEPQLPLSQRLRWAGAIEAVGGKSYVVFSPDEKVGGLVFSSTAGVYECINGPTLSWDHAADSPRQLATFVQAVTRLSPDFRSVSLRPRWRPSELKRRLGVLPVAPFAVTSASTLVIPVAESESAQLEALSRRMRRTLYRCWRIGVEVEIVPASGEALEAFVKSMTPFAEKRGFSVPPLAWFQALTQGWGASHLGAAPHHDGAARSGAASTSGGASSDPADSDDALSPFWLISATYRNGDQYSRSEILVSTLPSGLGTEAHYLFGREERSPGLRAAISTSAAAHWQALRLCAVLGIKEYDLNGYLTQEDPDHPYAGVAEFKTQFGGKVVEYSVPEFVIGVE